MGQETDPRPCVSSFLSPATLINGISKIDCVLGSVCKHHHVHKVLVVNWAEDGTLDRASIGMPMYKPSVAKT